MYKEWRKREFDLCPSDAARRVKREREGEGGRRRSFTTCPNLRQWPSLWLNLWP